MKELRPLTLFSCAVEDELRRAVFGDTELIFHYIFTIIACRIGC